MPNDTSARIGEATECLNRNHIGTYPRHTVMAICGSVFGQSEWKQEACAIVEGGLESRLQTCACVNCQAV